MNNILTYKPKNQGVACFIFALVAITAGGALCVWMGKLSILYVALSVILLVWGIGCLISQSNSKEQQNNNKLFKIKK